MSEFKRVLRHYGLTKAESNKPDWLKIRRRFGITTSLDGKVNPNTNKKSLVWSDFVGKLKNEIKRKYAYDTEEVITTIRYNVRAYNKDKKKEVVIPRTIEVFSTRENAKAQTQIELDRDLERLEADSPFDINGVDNYEEELQVATSGGAIHKIKGIKYVKMRFMRFKLDNQYITDVDRGEGTCCFDLFYHQYNDKMGIKKLIPKDREKAYNNLAEYFGANTLTDGLSINELEKFCRDYKITLLALDKNEKTIIYKPVENRNLPALIFIVANNHIYPILDKSKRLTLTRKSDGSSKTPFTSENIVDSKDGSDRNLIHTYIKGNELSYVKAEKEIKRRNTIPRKVSLVDNQISKLYFGDECVHIDEPEYDFGKEWKGETPYSICMDMFETFKQDDPCNKSIFNSKTREMLELKGVKDRNQFGSVLNEEETKKYEELLPPKILKLYYDKYETLPVNSPLDKYGFKIPTKITKKVRVYVDIELPQRSNFRQKFVDGDIQAIDGNKFYATCLAENTYDFPVYDEECSFEDYDGVLKNGLYIVETDDTSLFHQSNIYSRCIIDEAIKYGIPFKIRKQLIAKKYIRSNYFADFFDFIKSCRTLKDISLRKLVINILTGILGRTENKKQVVELDTDYEAIYRYFFLGEEYDGEQKFYDGKFKAHRNNLILKKLGEGENSVYMYGYEIKSKLTETTLPIYFQILDLANVRLYRLGQKLGGKLLYRKTDCLVVENPTIPVRDMTKNWGDYSIENKSSRFKWYKPMRTDRHVEFNLRDDDWKTYDHNDSDDYEAIAKTATDNGGLLIEGRAGTGKTFSVMKSLGEWTGEKFIRFKDNTIAMSFTNKASRNIKGSTIHKTMKITKDIKVCRKALAVFKQYKYIIIDEIGMIEVKLWRLLIQIKRTYPHIIFILMGDYRQLPPIKEEVDIFNYSLVKELCNNNRIELTAMKRYEKPLWDYLERGYEKRDWSGLESKELTIDEICNSRNISFYNSGGNQTKIKIDKMCMEYKKDDDSVLVKLNEKQEKNIKLQNIWLYCGLPLMSYTNCKKLGIVNSEEFIVNNYDDKKIFIDREEGGETIEIEYDELHNYFIPNYCATAHKSQGSTYQGQINIWDFYMLRADRRRLYTACSRAKALENIIVSKNVI